MDTIQVGNLKSITNSGQVKLRPITVFVGTNSSGKSSLIRCIPLFKQSAESKTLGTVLWSGKYVDYGSFIESLNFENKNSATPGEIFFTFELKIGTTKYRRALVDVGTPVKFTVSVHGDEYTKTSYTRFEYEIYGNIISIKYNSDLKILALHINGTDFTKAAQDHLLPYKAYSITPILLQRHRSAQSSEQIIAVLVNELKQHVHHRTSHKKIERIARTIKIDSDEKIKKILSNKSLMGDFAASKIANWSTSSIDFRKIKEQIIFCSLDELVDQTSDYIADFFRASKYITPLRAAADRYYRIHNTSIEELDPNGSNLAMFLHAKNDEERSEINTWLQNEIGFTIEISSSQGHASIFIIDTTGTKSNIADTGFGFSQILPILIQIWHLSKHNRSKYRSNTTPITIVIEQPELHLHPKMQSRIGEAFCRAVNTATKNDIDLRIIIETHSKDIIDSIGRCIDNRIVTKDDVSIYIVEKGSDKCILESSYDDGGYLVNWPYGFFDGA